MMRSRFRPDGRPPYRMVSGGTEDAAGRDQRRGRAKIIGAGTIGKPGAAWTREHAQKAAGCIGVNDRAAAILAYATRLRLSMGADLLGFEQVCACFRCRIFGARIIVREDGFPESVAVWKYISAHWRGEQGILRSSLINGVLLYVILVTGLVSLSTGPSGQLTVLAGLVVFLLWLTWASVGILRCGARNALDRANAKISRLGGLVAIIGVLLGAFFSVKDMIRLFNRGG